MVYHYFRSNGRLPAATVMEVVLHWRTMSSVLKYPDFVLSNLRFADDICLIADGNDDLQHTVDKVYTTGNRFGLEVSRTKTEVQCTAREKQQMKTLLGGTELTQCEEFVYLGCVVSADGFCDRDADKRIGLAAGIVRNLHSIRKAEDISKSTKVLLYQSMVQSIVLYNSDT